MADNPYIASPTSNQLDEVQNVQGYKKPTSESNDGKSWWDSVSDNVSVADIFLPGSTALNNWLQGNWTGNATKSPAGYDSLMTAMAGALVEQAGYDLNITYDENGTPQYNVTKKEDPRVQQLIDKYGADSSQVSDERNKIAEQSSYTADAKDNIDRLYYDKVQRILSGDMSLTPSQDSFVNQQVADRNKVAYGAYQALMSDINSTEGNVDAKLGEWNNLITQGKISIGNALDVLGTVVDTGEGKFKEAVKGLSAQIENTNLTAGQAMEQSIAQARELANIGLNEQATRIYQQAALLGRSPSDTQIQRSVMDNIQKVNVSLGVAESEQRKGLALDTGAKREAVASSMANYEERLSQARQGIQQQRVALEQATQGSYQNIAALRAQLSENTGLRREAATAGYGNNQNAIATDASNMRYNLAALLPAQQVAAGQNSRQLDSALNAQNIQNYNSIFSSFQNPYQMETGRLGATLPYAPTPMNILDTLASLGITAASV